MAASKNNPDIRELVKKFFEKRYPADIEERFHLWLLDDGHGNEKNEALREMWETTGCGSSQDAKGSLQQVRKRLGFPASTVRPLRQRFALKVAAVIIPFMVIAGGYILWNNRPAGEDAPQVSYLEAAPGSRVVLADNTVVEVKEGILFYPSEFRGYERRVKFDGTAYFTVAGDAARPFVIEGTVLDIRVTGTQFMVSTDSDVTRTRVSLVEGTVDVLIGQMDPVALNQGNELTYDSGSGELNIAPMSPALATKEALSEGKLVFSGATLGEILTAVAHSRGMEISMPPSLGTAAVYEVKFTRDDTIEEILNVLKVLSDGFNYQLVDKTIFIE